MIEVRVSESSPHYERIVLAATTVYPGMFVKPFGATPEGYEERAYAPSDDAVTNGPHPPLIAVGNIYHGKSIVNTYEAGERMHIRLPRAGDMVLTKITADGGSGIIEGYPYTYDAAGWLRNWDVVSDIDYYPVGISMETDLTPDLPRWTVVMITR
jgi:hypothetical protein